MKGLKKVKLTIRKHMIEKGASVFSISKRADINVLKMAYLLYLPFSKIKLTQGMNVCKALEINISKLF